jgi:hypothetical protein
LKTGDMANEKVERSSNRRYPTLPTFFLDRA